MAAHKKLGTWSTINGSNTPHKAVKTCLVLDIEHDAEGKKTRHEARLVAQGFKQASGPDFDETWAPVPNTATSRFLFALAAANASEVHHVDVKTVFLDALMDKEVYIKLPDGVESGCLRIHAG